MVETDFGVVRSLAHEFRDRVGLEYWIHANTRRYYRPYRAA